MAGVRPENEPAVAALLASFTRIALSGAIASRAVQIRRQSRFKLPDAVILATAEIEDRILFTRNTRDFKPAHPNIRIPYFI